MMYPSLDEVTGTLYPTYSTITYTQNHTPTKNQKRNYIPSRIATAAVSGALTFAMLAGCVTATPPPLPTEGGLFNGNESTTEQPIEKEEPEQPPEENGGIQTSPSRFNHQKALEIITLLDAELNLTGDKSIVSLIKSKPWFTDGVSEEEAMFIYGISDIALQYGSMSDLEESMNYIRGLINNAPDSYTVSVVSLSTRSIPLLVTSQNTDVMATAVETIQVGLPIIEKFLGIDHPAQSVRVHLGYYYLGKNLAQTSRVMLPGGRFYTYVIMPETKSAFNTWDELTHTFIGKGPKWWKEGITEFMEYFVAEQVKNEPWFDSLDLYSWVKENKDGNLIGIGYEYAKSEVERLRIQNSLIKGVEGGDSYHNYVRGHIFWTGLYWILGEKGTTEICAELWPDKWLTEEKIQTTSLEIASKYGVHDTVKRLFTDTTGEIIHFLDSLEK